MHWITLKNTLLYGQPPLNGEYIRPDTLRLAVREIIRLLRVEWLDTLNKETLARIQQTCEVKQCIELWEELSHYNRKECLKGKQRNHEHSLAESSNIMD